MCFDEALPGFFLRCGGFGLRTSYLLDWSATTGFSFDSRLQSENNIGDTGNAGFTGEFLAPILLAEVLDLRRVRLSIEVDGRGAVSKDVDLMCRIASK